MGVKEDLIKRKTELEKELFDVNTALNAILGSSSEVKASPAVTNVKFYGGGKAIPIGSPKGDTWLEQITNFIKDSNRFVHNSEIAKAINPLYPDKEESKVKLRISAVLSHALTNEKVSGLVNHQIGKSKKNTYWGKDAWLDENGKILKEYQPKKRKEKEQSKIEL
jgi:hypothetical protein